MANFLDFSPAQASFSAEDAPSRSFCERHRDGRAAVSDALQGPRDQIKWRTPMARKTPKGKNAAFMMFNVTYEDGSVTSNRRISNELLDQSFGDALHDLAHAAIMEQDNEIARRSNQPRAKIKSIARA